MKKLYYIKTLFFTALFAALVSCGSDEGSDYTELPPVSVDLTLVPYAKLSEYKFFQGELKNLVPEEGVLPYGLNSELFTDYADKKRFVWMPKGTTATYNEDGEVLNFPAGAALIKVFYYDHVMPGDVTKIIETRIMIKKQTGWIFANYVWNNEQTEAFLDLEGQSQAIEWNHNGTLTSISYKIPSEIECMECHQLDEIVTPIGPKPQNLNKNFAYTEGLQNQMSKWQEVGYLDSYPQTIASTIDWQDESQPLDMRVRSYLEVNCAHCHRPGNWEHQTLNLQFSETANPVNLGVCVEPSDFVMGQQTHIVAKGNVPFSLMHFRMSSNVQSEMMPKIGRTVVHQEGLQLVEDWINSLEGHCP